MEYTYQNTDRKYDNMFYPERNDLQITNVKEEFLDDEAPLGLVSTIQTQLNSIFKNLPNCANFSYKIISICFMLQRLCSEDEDMALGSIHMARDMNYWVSHPIQTAIVCEILSRQLGWPQEKRLILLCASITMNISMLESQGRLYSKNGSLNEEEKQFIKSHPEESVKILKALGVQDEDWLRAVLEHHEAVDGTGYPRGLKDEEISSAAKVIFLVDVYCARISPRSYRVGLMPNVAMNKIYLDTKTSVDNNMALVLIKHLGIYPPGSYVRLNNDEVGVVIQRGDKVYCPIVYVLFKANGKRTIAPLRRDTSMRSYEIKEVLYPTQVVFDVNPYQLWGYGVFKRDKATRRKHQRFQTSIKSKILDATRVLTSDATIINLSRAGCLLRTTREMNKGYELNKDYFLTFRFMNKTLENIRIRVRNKTDIFEHSLFGTEFVRLEHENRLYIRSFVAKVKLCGQNQS